MAGRKFIHFGVVVSKPSGNRGGHYHAPETPDIDSGAPPETKDTSGARKVYKAVRPYSGALVVGELKNVTLILTHTQHCVDVQCPKSVVAQRNGGGLSKAYHHAQRGKGEPI